MFDKRKCFADMLAQLALEYNAQPADFTAEGLTLTEPRLHPKRRIYTHEAPFFQMATTGRGAVATADPVLHDFMRRFADGKSGHWLFERPNLAVIEAELNRHGFTLTQTFHMFLPGGAVPKAVMLKGFTVRWFDAESVLALYPNARFPNAVGASPNLDRPDVIAAAACDGDEIAALAGASADTADFWQVGIDVLPEYRGRGLGKMLVRALCAAIEARGKMPFYGTSLSNLHSQNIALESGFYPAWVEVSSRKPAD